MISLKSKKAPSEDSAFLWKPGRGERIRTSDSYVPNVVLYQAELHPDFPHKSTITLNREGEQF